MTRVSLDPADEFAHEPGTTPEWGESWDLDLHSPADDLSGILRLTWRPEARTLDASVNLFLADLGFVAIRLAELAPRRPDRLEVEGFALEFDEPFARARVRYDGGCRSLRDVRDAGRRDAWEKAPLERLILDLQWQASRPPIRVIDAIPATPFTLVEQPGRCAGSIWISGDEYRLDGPANRSHVWGERAVHDASSWVWVSLGFEGGGALSAFALERPGMTARAGWTAGADATGEVRPLGVDEFRVRATAGALGGLEACLRDPVGRELRVVVEPIRVASLPLPAAGSSAGSHRWLHMGVARFILDGRPVGTGLFEALESTSTKH